MARKASTGHTTHVHIHLTGAAHTKRSAASKKAAATRKRNKRPKLAG